MPLSPKSPLDGLSDGSALADAGPGETGDAFSDLLTRAREGDSEASRALFVHAYDQLKRVAHIQRRRGMGGGTLNTTALVHEVYVKLAGRDGLVIRDRGHFLAVAAMAMRHILLDGARRVLATKRGGGRRAASLDRIEAFVDGEADFCPERAEVLLDLDDSLRRLAQRSERHSRVVECRFFAGMSISETAEALGISPATVKRDWLLAQAWLHRDLQGRT